MPRYQAPQNTRTVKPYSQAIPTKRTTHFPEQFKPEKPAHQFKNRYMINSRANQYVRQMLFEVKPQVVDFHLAVANFLFETSHLVLPDIPQSVEIVLKDFDILFPLVSCNHDILTCAHHIQTTINKYLASPSTTPKPFALRFPNIKALKNLIVERSKTPRALDSDKAIVLVDVVGRFLAMGLPPSPNHLERALKALEGSAKIHHLHCFIGPIPKDLACCLPPLNPAGNSPDKYVHQSRHSKLSNHPVPVPGALHEHLSYESIGYSLGSINARADRKIQLGLNRQGYHFDDLKDWPVEDCHLPVAMGLGEESLFKRTDNARQLQELHWPYKVSRVVNASVQPKTYQIADKIMDYVIKNSGPLVSERLGRSDNRIVHVQHVNYNIQVAPHRDGMNSNLIDSVFAYGRDYVGGRWLFGFLGISFCANPGYSAHGFFKYLDHAVETIVPTSDKPPSAYHLPCTLMPLESAARAGKYNESLWWLPFPSPDFSVEICRKILRKEENQWKKLYNTELSAC
ncbi:hypothetical protein DFH28DRAFT_1090440 [Melampsora americana]|nr:hypothetical protein DFH28DRAFT_1090440 [Melampsora americana]